MFLLMGVGIFLFRKNWFSEITVKELNNFLLFFVVPAAIITSFQMELDVNLLSNLFIALILSISIHIISILCSTLIFGKKTLTSRLQIFASTYSNSSFMAFPLLFSIYGELGIFYGCAYTSIFNIVLWSHGVSNINPKNDMKFSERAKNIYTNPVIISAILGVIFYATNIRFPNVISESLGYIGSLNTPLAMVLIGVFMAKCNFRHIDFKILVAVFFKLLAMPLIFIVFMKIITIFINIDETLTLSILISASCPTAGVVAMICDRYNINTEFAVKAISFTNILCLITIPIIFYIAQLVL